MKVVALFEGSKALESLNSEGKKMARGGQTSMATISHMQWEKIAWQPYLGQGTTH